MCLSIRKNSKRCPICFKELKYESATNFYLFLNNRSPNNTNILFKYYFAPTIDMARSKKSMKVQRCELIRDRAVVFSDWKYFKKFVVKNTYATRNTTYYVHCNDCNFYGLVNVETAASKVKANYSR